MTNKTMENLVKIANWLMVITIIILAIWFYGYLVTITFDLRVFAERTSTFLGLFVLLATVTVISAAILSISINLTIIAKQKNSSDIEQETQKGKKRFLVIIAIILLVTIPIGLVSGDFLTKNHEQKSLKAEADNLVENYSSILDSITKSISEESELEKIPERMKFLSSQRSDFNYVDIIFPVEYENRLTYIMINQSTHEDDVRKPYFNYSFYRVDQDTSKYLYSIFKENKNESKIIAKNRDIVYFKPYQYDNHKILLRFSNRKYYGKIGS